MTQQNQKSLLEKHQGLYVSCPRYSAFVYNILTMGLIFPWTYLWAPGALPGGKLGLGHFAGDGD